MFIVQDIETLGIESTSVILSNTFILVDPDALPEDNTEAFEYLLKKSITVKFNVKEQFDKGRTTEKRVIDWWKKQSEHAKRESLIPRATDFNGKQGIRVLRDWFSRIPNAKQIPVWVRGSLDQPCFDSFLRLYEEMPFTDYNCYRDVRTMVELVYSNNSKAGYVEVPGFDDIRYVIKHVPSHDCAYDALMMLRGKI